MLFTLLAERYERRSVMVMSNLVQPADRIFRDQMATAATIDRPVHPAVVLEFDVPSYRTGPVRPQVAAARAPSSGYRERGDTEGNREAHNRITTSPSGCCAA